MISDRLRIAYLKTMSPFMVDSENIVFDLGANDGSDTEFYLRKGFKVVAVEANPILAGQLAERFAKQITSRQLSLLGIGVSDRFGESSFYINEKTDHWSSFDLTYGGRDGTAYQTVSVRTLPLAYIMLRYGCPYYMKIDVEGFDKGAIRQLKEVKIRPRFISFEEYGLEGFSQVAELGYKRFFIATQHDKGWARSPNPPSEGLFVDRVSTWSDSGLFGREVPGPWLDLTEAQTYYEKNVRGADFSYRGPPGEWFDIHARLD